MKKLLPLLLFFSFYQVAFAQDKTEAALQELEDKYAQEKIHLFFNREVFVAGENTWFKAYVFSGYVLSLISTNLYVELYNDKKELIDKTEVPLISATGNGQLNLPASLPEGIYYVRAYTAWMLNFDESFQYLQAIRIYNPKSPKRLSLKPVKYTPLLFPESGSILENEENRITVRLEAEGSLPASFSGYVTEKNDTAQRLTSFNSYNSQIASFAIKPLAGKEYAVHILDPLGHHSILPLKAKEDGVLIKTSLNTNRLTIMMKFGKGQQAGSYKLLGQMSGQVVLRARIDAKETGVRTSVPVDKWMSGILHLTLFDAGENPVAERLVFIHNDSLQTGMISTPVFSAAARADNSWKMDLDTTQFLTYAVSIEDASISIPRQRSIYTDLWLGDLSSAIDQPNWYFTAADPNRIAALDALMITEKWTRFNWSSLKSGQFPQIKIQPEKFLSFKGSVTRNGKPLAEEALSLMFRFPDSSSQFVQVKTDKNGGFRLNNVAFYDTVKLFYQSNAPKSSGKDLVLKMEKESHFLPFQGEFPLTYFQLADRKEAITDPLVLTRLQSMQNVAELDRQYHQMEEIRVEARVRTAKEQLDEKLSSPLFQTGNQTVFDFVNEEQNVLSYTNIFDWLDGRVAGLSFTTANGHTPTGTSLVPAEPTSLSREGQRVPIMRDGEVAVFLDEMPVDLEAIYSLPVSEIAMVKVIKGYFLGGASGGGGHGAIVVYTKKAGLIKPTNSPSLPSGILTGYPTIKPFPHLNYADESTRKLKNDIRDQLYWNDLLYPDGEGKATLHFYNNDSAKTFRIIITGFTKDARPVFIEKIVDRKIIE